MVAWLPGWFVLMVNFLHGFTVPQTSRPTKSTRCGGVEANNKIGCSPLHAGSDRLRYCYRDQHKSTSGRRAAETRSSHGLTPARTPKTAKKKSKEPRRHDGHDERLGGENRHDLDRRRVRCADRCDRFTSTMVRTADPTPRTKFAWKGAESSPWNAEDFTPGDSLQANDSKNF